MRCLMSGRALTNRTDLVAQHSSVLCCAAPPGYVELGHVAVPALEVPLPVKCPALCVANQETMHKADSCHAVPCHRGYVELGHVAVPALEEPPPRAVRCLRADLAKPAQLFGAPVWHGASGDNQWWECSLWCVDSPAGTFLAERGKGRPQASAARMPSF